MGAIKRKYGVATTLNFTLLDTDGIDFTTSPVFSSGDAVVSKDEGAFAITGSTPSSEGSGAYSLALTATEMQAARIVVLIVDQTDPKVWLDDSIVIETYGHASAQHEFDLDTAFGVAEVWNEVSILGEVDDGSPAADGFDTNLTVDNDELNGQYLWFTSGVNDGIGRRIIDTVATNGALDFTTQAFPNAPADNDTFRIGGRIEP